MTTLQNARKRPIFFRKAATTILSCFTFLSLCLAISCMCWILITVFSHGMSAISPGFLLNISKPYGESEGGIANALLGTLCITLGSILIAVPPALAAGIYLSEFGKQSRVAIMLRFCANVLMGIPSILVGLFVYVLLVVSTGHFSGFAGSVALAIIMFPVIMRTTEDMLSMVPNTLREASLALGMTRMRATLCIVARSAKNGLATGILLALARVSGETAPLLFTAMFADTWPTSFFTNPTANIPVLITEYTTNSPFESMHSLGWGAAFIITFIILLINLTTRLFFHENKH